MAPRAKAVSGIQRGEGEMSVVVVVPGGKNFG